MWIKYVEYKSREISCNVESTKIEKIEWYEENGNHYPKTMLTIHYNYTASYYGYPCNKKQVFMDKQKDKIAKTEQKIINNCIAKYQPANSCKSLLKGSKDYDEFISSTESVYSIFGIFISLSFIFPLCLCKPTYVLWRIEQGRN